MNGNIKIEIIVNFNFNWMFQWQIPCTETTSLLKLTRNVPKSYHQPQCTLKFFSENRVFFVCFEHRASLRRQRHVQFVSCIQFFLIRSSFNPTNIFNAYEKGGGDGDEQCAPVSESSTWVTIQNRHMFGWTLFLTMTHISRPKVLTFPPESPCIKVTILPYVTVGV